jgi:hypothetical protein
VFNRIKVVVPVLMCVNFELTVAGCVYGAVCSGSGLYFEVDSPDSLEPTVSLSFGAQTAASDAGRPERREFVWNLVRHAADCGRYSACVSPIHLGVSPSDTRIQGAQTSRNTGCHLQ